MKVALISDVHANLPALKAVLKHAAGYGVKKIINLGDFIGYCPFPEQVVNELRRKNAVNIIGNYDLKVLDFPYKKNEWQKTKLPEKFFSFKWAWQNISRSTKIYLSKLPARKILVIAGKKFLLTHAGPKSMDEIITYHTPLLRFKQLIKGLKVDAVLLGHSHCAFKRKVKGIWFFNPGSVGRQFCGNWQTSYAILEIDEDKVKFTPFRLTYDVNKAITKMSRCKFPQKILRCIKEGKEMEELS